MNRKLIGILLVAVTVFALTGLALAQGGRGGRGGCPMGGCPMGGMQGPGGPMMMPPFWTDPEIAQKMGLNDGQKKALDDLSYDFRQKMIAAHAEIENARLALDRAFADGSADQAVNAAAKRLSDAQDKMFQLHTDNQLKLRKILTADQWKILQTLHPQRGFGPGPGHGRGLGRGGDSDD